MESNLGWIIAAIGLMGTALGWYTHITIKSAFSDFREDIRKEFGVQFMDSKLASEKLTNMTRDIEFVKGRVDEIEDYAHERVHSLTGEVQECKLKLGLINHRKES